MAGDLQLKLEERKDDPRLGYRDLLYGSYRGTNYALINAQGSDSFKYESYDLAIGAFLPSDLNSRILDVGCGSGFLMNYLIRRGYRNVFGVDRSPEQVEYCRRDGLDVELAETTSYLKEHRGWDLITSTDHLEHLTKPEILEFLTAARDALAARGALYIRTLNAASLAAAIGRWNDFTHENSFTERSLRQILLACGFSEVVLTDDKPPFGWKPRRLARWAALKCLRQAQRIILTIEVGVDRPQLYGKALMALATK